ncbi:CDP-glycerol glycerophosphotransferase family protein [Brevibacterium sp. UCMA 11752]|uniref:CDP-glycerol glycerophosphotransferase family protein n=1 Tax=Brevibacterium sp. UCMA 11752 TaxID=2745946 RepID=UPI001F300563|nr:CDP-glycerol glycerophosphotransferase family protein [Brevibacterium sp. UCMA 11752]MCF2587199.1 CDP-glycerol glycerophosphotransferase family protein [Brevibacterium sp. UCMA 11752]
MSEELEIVDIKWERVNVTYIVEFTGDEVEAFYLTSNANPGEKLYPIAFERVDTTRYELTINVTLFNRRGQVPNGTYFLVALTGVDLHPANFPLANVGELDEHSRAFVYNKNRSAYTVTFGVSDNDGAPYFLMRTYSFGRSAGKPSSTRARMKSKLKSKWVKAKRKTLRGVFAVAAKTRPAEGNNVLFASEARPNMQGNLKAVHDRMLERGLDQDFNFGYSFRTGRTSSRQNALNLAWQMGKANTILIDDYFAVLKDLGDRNKQKIIQLWHAGSGFKSVGYSRFGQYGSPNLRNAHRLYSYAICGSQHLRDVYSEAFGIEREAVLATGLPRIDGFLREGRADEILPEFEAEFPDSRGKRKILLAPTFRGRGSGDAHYDYEEIDFPALYEACGQDTVVLFRQHHFIPEPAPIPSEFSDRLIDVASFPDTNDLLLISDVLVTDYSSVIYEYSLLERPMIFFAYDLETYSATRGMHRAYEEAAPGSIATTFDELVALMREPELSVEKTKEFVRENFDHVDTNNSDRVIDTLVLADPIVEFASDGPISYDDLRDRDLEEDPEHDAEEHLATPADDDATAVAGVEENKENQWQISR